MPTRPSIRLTAYQVERLQALRASARKTAVHRRATVMILTAQGHSIQQICEATGYSEAGVLSIRRRFRQEGWVVLEGKPIPGRPPTCDEEYLQMLKDVVLIPPTALGFAFTVWSLPRLEAYMKELTGISISTRHLSRLLHRLGFSWQKAKHKTDNNFDPKAYRKAKRLLKALKKGPAAGTPPMSSGSRMRAASACCLT